MNFLQKTLTTAGVFALAVAGIPFSPANAQVGYESACREVNTQRNNLNVRARPTTDSAIIGSLPPGTIVEIESELDTWVPITEPTDGYVYSPYLEYCRENPGETVATNTNTDTTSAGEFCRQVSQRRVAPIRRDPSSTSPIISTLQAGREMTIENIGASGWVPVSNPIDGYVSASRLTYCD